MCCVLTVCVVSVSVSDLCLLLMHSQLAQHETQPVTIEEARDGKVFRDIPQGSLTVCVVYVQGTCSFAPKVYLGFSLVAVSLCSVHECGHTTGLGPRHPLVSCLQALLCDAMRKSLML